MKPHPGIRLFASAAALAILVNASHADDEPERAFRWKVVSLLFFAGVAEKSCPDFEVDHSVYGRTMVDNGIEPVDLTSKGRFVDGLAEELGQLKERLASRRFETCGLAWSLLGERGSLIPGLLRER